jgi:transcriptional regulator with XRE-family HTH domain
VSDILQKFGQHLRSLRLARQVSQEQLAADAGLHRTYVSSVERGERNVSLVNIERLARALEVPLPEMLPPVDSSRRGKK